jgi:tetratricopeptide (TPR) repeat protein
MKHKCGLLICGILGLLLPALARSEPVKAYEGEVTLPTYPWQPDIKHPYFPETDGRGIYPYTMQDDLRPDRAPRTYKTVVLESDLAKLTFIPELGGRIWEAIDKITGKPIFYVNHVVKPGLIAMRGAWISGGVEFNTGPQGHTVTAISPTDILILPNEEDGSRSVAVGDTDRIYRLPWTVIVTLRPGRRFIEQRVTIYNKNETVCPYYYWNCTAQPNTPGFRFVYPMTLGTDHAGTTFYKWPVNDGVDLSWGKNYKQMSSIFAYECDQDFFGSYDVDEDRGCVAFADHRQLPGKKAWTWSWGGDGIAHQRMLTDEDGPYNEVQTGPLRTQAETGRLDPHEAISWKEWWYPVQGLGGPFTYANRDICARAEIADEKINLRIIGTGTWTDATVKLDREDKRIESWEGDITPCEPFCWETEVGEPPIVVTVSHGDRELASFKVPLSLPERERPKERATEASPEAIASEGWKELLLGRRDGAISAFEKALKKDPGCLEALLGLTHYKLVEARPEEAEDLARRAIEENPYDGRAHYSLAVALHRQGKDDGALDSAWKAAFDPATVVAGRALVGKVLIRRGELDKAVEALSAPGPWGDDPVCRDRLAIAFLQEGQRDEAARLATATLRNNPLDALAWYVLVRLDRPVARRALRQLLSRDAECILELAFELSELGMPRDALVVLERGGVRGSPMIWYTANYLRAEMGLAALSSEPEPAEGIFPSRLEELAVLQHAVDTRPDDALSRVLLGDIHFHFRQYGAARKLWEEAAQLDPSNSVPLRSLGLAAWRLDGDLAKAEQYLRSALSRDPNDGIIGRDLARVLIAQSDAAAESVDKKTLRQKAREVLLNMLPPNIHRADLLEMTARLHNQLDEPEKAAELLDSIRVTNWEGAQGLHDEFRKAHFALGKAHFEAERFDQAAAEFQRSLEYPENLGIGKREGTREADLYYWLGISLSRAGKAEEARAAWEKAASERPSGNAEVERCRELAQEALKKASVP